MLFVVEGPDGAGKSTFANMIHEQVGGTVIHASRPRAVNGWQEYVEPIKDYVPGKSGHVILDRWHLGEVVYPVTMGRKSIYGKGEFDLVDAWLAHRGALLVAKTADLEDAMVVHTLRSESVDRNQLWLDMVMWEHVFEMTRLHVLEVPLGRGEALVDDTINIAKHLEEEAMWSSM